MSRWTHSVCEPCFTALHPDRDPVKFTEEHRPAERCCRCGVNHRSGIYVRANPDTLLCQGVHPEEVEA